MQALISFLKFILQVNKVFNKPKRQSLTRRESPVRNHFCTCIRRTQQ